MSTDTVLMLRAEMGVTMRAATRIAAGHGLMASLLVCACGSHPVTVDVPNRVLVADIEVTAYARVTTADTGAILTVDVTITNRGSAVAAVELPVDCQVSLSLFDVARRGVWDQRAWAPASSMLCSLIVAVHEIGVEESITMPAAMPVARILGDSLPTARYQVVARTWMNPGGPLQVHAGTVTLP